MQADSRMRSSLYAAKLVVSAPLWNGRFSFGTEETFTNRHDIFTQNGFSADADDHIKQSVYAAFADYSRSIRHWKLNREYVMTSTNRLLEKGIRIVHKALPIMYYSCIGRQLVTQWQKFQPLLPVKEK